MHEASSWFCCSLRTWSRGRYCGRSCITLIYQGVGSFFIAQFHLFLKISHDREKRGGDVSGLLLAFCEQEKENKVTRTMHGWTERTKAKVKIKAITISKVTFASGPKWEGKTQTLRDATTNLPAAIKTEIAKSILMTCFVRNVRCPARDPLTREERGT